MSKKKDLHLKISEKMYNTIEDNADVQDLNKSEYIRQLIATDNGNGKSNNIENKLNEIERLITNIDTARLKEQNEKILNIVKNFK